MKIHVKFCGVLDLTEATEKFKICFQFLCRSLKKGKGLNYPQVYSHWSSPLEVPQLIGRDVTLSLFPIGPKNDLQKKEQQNPRQLRVASKRR